MNSPHQKPRIAIPVPTSRDSDYNERCWPQYAAAVEGVGGEPVRIPLGMPPSETATLAADCAGVLLPGSPADVHPQKYGEPVQPQTAAADAAREATDELLLQDAFHLRKPVLGVCFGLQMVNVWRGGTLAQHLGSSHAPAPGQEKAPLSHTLKVEPEAMLLRSFFLDSTAPRVNSSHHQAVARVGDGLRIAALAEPDGTIEAVESASPEEQFILGVQWHPERSYPDDQPSLALFTAFVAASHRWRLPRT